MAYLYKKAEKKQVSISKEEWEELKQAYLEMMEELEGCEDKKLKNKAWQLGTVVFELGNKGNWQ
jgi:hypothetical protein